MAVYCANCFGSLRERARFCSHCGVKQPLRNSGGYESVKVSGYRSNLRETAYLEPEWLEKAEEAIKQYEDSSLSVRQRTVPAGGGRLGAYRDVVFVMLLPYLTLGFYKLYWWWRTGGEIRDYMGGDDLSPARDLVLILLTCGLWQLFMYYNYGLKIAQMQEKARLPRNEALKWVCPLLGLFFMGFVSVGLMQDELNKIWEAESYAGR